MDIKELNKTQLILLTLLITFVVSIATGIVTVTLMNQMPKSATQTINNVIQRTIEKVTTVQAPSEDKKSGISLSDNAVLVPIYDKNYKIVTPSDTDTNVVVDGVRPFGQGVIISDSGLILVESSVLFASENEYKIVLGKDLFDAKVLKNFGNGFVVLQIQSKSKITDEVKPADPKATDTPVDLNTAPKQ
ncbi:MAG: hypothetical protein KBD48_03360 [Candidatus Pacebacteria bacterium]|nr:hypothetical protein [Candidatus Paceibacterota bacterium]MBP9716198.1 hypothetical protein [Candidatus Paceibacterota bacterium]